MKRIAIQGSIGSFHDIAAHQYFKDEQIHREGFRQHKARPDRDRNARH